MMEALLLLLLSPFLLSPAHAQTSVLTRTYRTYNGSSSTWRDGRDALQVSAVQALAL